MHLEPSTSTSILLINVLVKENHQINERKCIPDTLITSKWISNECEEPETESRFRHLNHDS